MISLPIYSFTGSQAGKKELDSSIFGLPLRQDLIQQSVISFLANRRSVISKTKDRSEVRGGGKKPWRQKGTGNARAGSIRSPLWRGGGVTFGPTTDRNWKKRLNAKMRQGAFRSALSAKVADQEIIIIDSLANLDGKSREWHKSVKNLPLNNASYLVVDTDYNPTVDQSIRNHDQAKYTSLHELTIYDLLNFHFLVITSDAIDTLSSRLATSKKEKVKV